MKNIFIALFFLILVISVLYFDILEWNQFNQKTRLVAVNYYAENCPKCKTLNQKMRKVEWLFAQKPIVFIHYDIHQKIMNRKIKRMGFQETVRSEVGVGYVQVYDVIQQKPLLKITPNLSWEEMEEKIAILLEKNEDSLNVKAVF